MFEVGVVALLGGAVMGVVAQVASAGKGDSGGGAAIACHFKVCRMRGRRFLVHFLPLCQAAPSELDSTVALPGNWATEEQGQHRAGTVG